MSVSKWRYVPEICDGDYCAGDCDICPKDTSLDEDRNCCEKCQYRMVLEKMDYSQGGCLHTFPEGYACTAFSSEGIAIWLYGTDLKKEVCEMFKLRSQK